MSKEDLKDEASVILTVLSWAASILVICASRASKDVDTSDYWSFMGLIVTITAVCTLWFAYRYQKKFYSDLGATALQVLKDLFNIKSKNVAEDKPEKVTITYNDYFEELCNKYNLLSDETKK